MKKILADAVEKVLCKGKVRIYGKEKLETCLSNIRNQRVLQRLAVLGPEGGWPTTPIMRDY